MSLLGVLSLLHACPRGLEVEGGWWPDLLPLESPPSPRSAQ
jgi:hypothetical protein